MPQYKCSTCGHIFLQRIKKRIVCPQCNSLFSEEIAETAPPLLREVLIKSDLNSSLKNQTLNLDSKEIDLMTLEIDEKIKNIAGFSLEDQENIREDILGKWRLHLQEQFKQIDDYERTVKPLNPRMKKIINDLETLAGKLPTEWDEFLSIKLQVTPSYFRGLERTRTKIFEAWKDSLIQFEEKFGQEWNALIDSLSEINATYKKSAEISVEKLNQVSIRLNSELGVDEKDGVEHELRRHAVWLKMHIQQEYERDSSEQDRQKYWEERFSSPEQLWIVLQEERKLAREKKRNDFLNQISKEQNIFNEFQDWYKNKKQFYDDKLYKWVNSLRNLVNDNFSN